MKRISIYLMWISLAVVASSGQTQNTQDQDAQIQQAPVREGTRIPQALGSEIPPLTTSSEELYTNVLDLSLQVSALFDDNALSNNLNKHSDTGYDVQPTIEFKQELEQLQWNFFYSPGFSANQHFSQRRYFSQIAGTSLTYLLRPHLQLDVHGRANVKTNPFDQLDHSFSSPHSGLLDQTNTTVILPRYKQIGEEGGLGLTWLTSAFTTISLSGNFSELRYRDIPGVNIQQLKKLNTRIVNGRATVAHRVSAKHTLGVLYDYQDLSFPLAHARTVVHSIQGYDEFSITPSMKLTVFGGPEYSRVHDQVELSFFFFTFTIPSFTTQWSSAGGAQYDWQGAHSAFRGSFVRKVSDGGGLIGVVRLYDGRVDFRQRLTRRWTAVLDGDYATNNSLGPVSSSSLHSYAGSLGIERRISRDLSANLTYSRLHQNISGTLTGFRVDDDDRVMLSLQYHWSHPLGR